MSDIADKLKRGLVPFGHDHHEVVPAMPGLYSFWLRGRCLYVGMSDELQRRIQDHELREANPDLARHFRTYRSEIRISVVPHSGDLRQLESDAIRELRPVTNATGGGAP